MVEGGVDMLEALVAASDGEMDPRCLMLVFSAVQELVKTYSELGAASSQKLQQVRYALRPRSKPPSPRADDGCMECSTHSWEARACKNSVCSHHYNVTPFSAGRLVPFLSSS